MNAYLFLIWFRFWNGLWNQTVQMRSPLQFILLLPMICMYMTENTCRLLQYHHPGM